MFPADLLYPDLFSLMQQVSLLRFPILPWFPRDYRSLILLILEHLLLALLDNKTTNSILRSCGADTGRLRKDVNQFVEDTTPLLLDGDERDTQPTLGFQRVLQRAVFHIQ